MNAGEELLASIEAARKEIVAAGRYLGRRQYHVGLAGNISVRVSERLLVCTRHGADKEALNPDDLITCDLSGAKVDGDGKPTSELNMHRAAYLHRDDVRAVIHAHPPAATAFAAASMPLDQLQLPEMLVLLGSVALVPYATPGTEALASNLAPLLPNSDAFLLENHGALTLGRTVRQAALRMDLLEQNARISLMVRQLGKPFVLSPPDRETLMTFRVPMAGWGCEPFGDY
jgi:L-fuculose-phosphate aldolase